MRIQLLSKLAALYGAVLSLSLQAALTVYIPLGSGNGVVEVDAENDKIINHYQGVVNSHGLDISDDGTRLFITSKSEGKLVALDYKSGKQRVLPLSPNPYHLNTITDTGKVYISSRSTPSVWVVDQNSLGNRYH